MGQYQGVRNVGGAGQLDLPLIVDGPLPLQVIALVHTHQVVQALTDLGANVSYATAP